MFFNLMMILILVAPFPAIYSAISRRVKPYTAIGYGITAGSVAILVVFAVAFLSGQSFGDQMDKGIDYAVNTLVQNKEALKSLGFEELSTAKATALLTDAYKSMAVLLPSVFIILVTIVSYIEYNLTVKIRYSQSSGYVPCAYLRNFVLRSNDVMGWFIIYLVSYLMKFAGISIGEVAVMNINVLINTVISIQAMGLIFFVTYVKRRPRILAIVLSGLMWIFPMGRMGLFMIGLFDLLLNIRGKIREEYKN